MKKTFRSRVSILLLTFILAVSAWAFILSFQSKDYPAMFVLGGTMIFIVALLSGIRYVISEGKLFVKIWSISLRSIEIASIGSVKRSYNPLSSPAGSLKRLSIYARGKKELQALISPASEQDFIAELRAVNPHIDVDIPSDKQGLWRLLDWDI